MRAIAVVPLSLMLAWCANGSAQENPAASVGCKVTPLSEGTATQKSAYVGGCKDGLAEGEGSYSISVTRQDKPTIDVEVSGQFSRGVLNGRGKWRTTEGISFEGEFRNNSRTGAGVLISGAFRTEGEFRDGKAWNAVGRGSDRNGVRVAFEYKEGKQTALCRSDGRDEQNCTDRERLLGSTTQTASSAAARDSRKMQEEGRKSAAGSQGGWPPSILTSPPPSVASSQSASKTMYFGKLGYPRGGDSTHVYMSYLGVDPVSGAEFWQRTEAPDQFCIPYTGNLRDYP